MRRHSLKLDPSFLDSEVLVADTLEVVQLRK